jgi:hypothetical protein
VKRKEGSQENAMAGAQIWTANPEDPKRTCTDFPQKKMPGKIL